MDIVLHAFDESNTRIRPDRIERLVKGGDGGVVFLIGVQSNQFPRSLDLARALMQRGVQVVIGGFHVSGVISMLDGHDPDFRRAKEMGVSLFAGEAEGRLERVLQDAYVGTLRPLYNHMNDLPGIAGVPSPILPAHVVRRTLGNATSFDAGRGCRYQCSFCTIINVQGRKSRRRSPDDVEKIIRANHAQGLREFFVTDDNFARNKDWEAILDRLIYLRRIERLPFSLTIQVDTLCHRIPRFVEKCALAGVKTAFIGLENIHPQNLLGAKKRQNKITEYRRLLLAFKNVGILTFAGYILGFPDDTAEAILHDVEVIKRELPIELLEFFYLTPLPGSEDHQRLHRAGIPMDPDMNKYDLNHRVTGHARMTPQEWDEVYRLAWQRYYTLGAHGDDPAQGRGDRPASISRQCPNGDAEHGRIQGRDRHRGHPSARGRPVPAQIVATAAPSSASSRPGASIRRCSRRPSSSRRNGRRSTLVWDASSGGRCATRSASNTWTPRPRR